MKGITDDMELRVLRYFLTVAKEQSFTKAARQLHITQLTLPRQLAALETLAEICRAYREKYPLVQIAIHTATADTVYEMMNKGLVDIGLLSEPVDTEGFDYIRIANSDRWVVSMRPDDPLAKKEHIEKKDLLVQRSLYPQITANTVIAWRRNIPNSPAVDKFIEKISSIFQRKRNHQENSRNDHRSSVEMADKKIRPEIVDDNKDLSGYDEIILGFPIWWYVAPTIVNTFLEAHDFSGKKIVLFATSGGSGFGNTVKELQPSAPNAQIMEGRLLNRADIWK